MTNADDRAVLRPLQHITTDTIPAMTEPSPESREAHVRKACDAAYQRGFASGKEAGQNAARETFVQEAQQARMEREADIRRKAYSQGLEEGRSRGYQQALQDKPPRQTALDESMQVLAEALRQQGETNQWLAATVRQQGQTIRKLVEEPPISLREIQSTSVPPSAHQES